MEKHSESSSSVDIESLGHMCKAAQSNILLLNVSEL